MICKVIAFYLTMNVGVSLVVGETKISISWQVNHWVIGLVSVRLNLEVAGEDHTEAGNDMQTTDRHGQAMEINK